MKHVTQQGAEANKLKSQVLEGLCSHTFWLMFYVLVAVEVKKIGWLPGTTLISLAFICNKKKRKIKKN
jgi:hypothetical protein